MHKSSEKNFCEQSRLVKSQLRHPSICLEPNFKRKNSTQNLEPTMIADAEKPANPSLKSTVK